MDGGEDTWWEMADAEMKGFDHLKFTSFLRMSQRPLKRKRKTADLKVGVWDSAVLFRWFV